MIALIIAIILIAVTIYFWDDFPKWIAYAKKFWNDPSLPFQGNIRTKPKSKVTQVTQKDILEIQRQQRERLEEQMREAKKGFQEILDSHSQNGYGQDLKERLTRFQQQIDSRKTSKPKSSKGQKITDWERRFLWDGISKRKRVPCINCELEDMYKGRTDGPYQYWHCPSCGQGVKLSFYANTLSGFQCENIGIDKNKKHFM